MRGGWSSELRKRLWRPDPRTRLIVQADAVTASDHIQRLDQWSDADDTTAFKLHNDGRISINGSSSSAISHATGSGSADISTAYPHFSGSVPVAMIYWADEPFEVSSITARLDPSSSGDVDQWVMRVWQVMQYTTAASLEDGSTKTRRFSAAPVGRPVYVSATAGGSASDVEFAFPANDRPVVPTPDAPITDLSTAPAFFVSVHGITSAGDAASNISWVTDTGSTSITSGNNEIERIDLTAGTWGAASYSPATASGVPRVNIKKQSFTDQTITFTTNPLDLGSVPTETVRFRFRDSTPGDTAVTYEVDDGTAGFTAVTSGQTAADIGLTKVQTYDIRATLATSTGQTLTPFVHSMSVEEVTTTDLDGIATAEATGGWQFDPITLKGSIPEARIRILRDGLKDFEDTGTRLLAGNAPADLSFTVYYGWKDSSGDLQGMEIDTFDVDDWSGTGTELVIVGVGRNARLNAALPTYDTVNDRRTRLEYESQGLKTTYDAILNEIALDAALTGPGVEDDATTATNYITDSTALAELDAIAHLDGSTVISSQGRIRTAKIYEDGRDAIAFFPRDSIQPDSISPGYRARSPDFYVPYDYDFDTNEFTAEVRSVNSNAIASVNPDRIDGPKVLDTSIARWIDTEALATTVGTRVTESAGTGLLLWSFTSVYPHPHLEPGDVVAIETDRFVAKDPTSAARGLKGYLWAVGTVQRVGDMRGTQFTVWVQSYADIVASNTTAARIGYQQPQLLGIEPKVSRTGVVTADFIGNAATGGIRYATSTSATPSLATVQAASVQATTAHIFESGTLDTLAVGETLYIAALATENGSTPYGREQSYLVTAKIERPGAIVPVVEDKTSQSGSSGIYTVDITDPDSRLNGVKFKTHQGAANFDFTDPTDGTWTERLWLVENSGVLTIATAGSAGTRRYFASSGGNITVDDANTNAVTIDRASDGDITFTDDATPYSETVALTEKHNSYIARAVGYDDDGGTQRWMIRHSPFDADNVAEITAMSIGLDDSNQIEVTVAADEDTRTTGGNASIAVTVNVGSAPSDPTDATNDGEVTASRSGTVTTATTASQGDVVYARAVAFNGSGTAGTVLSATKIIGTAAEPGLGAVFLVVSDTGAGGDLEYDYSWNLLGPVTDSFNLYVTLYKDGTEVTTVTESSPVTDEGVTQTYVESGAGDGLDNTTHHAVFILENAAGGTVDQAQTPVKAAGI